MEGNEERWRRHALLVDNVEHRYGDRQALRGLRLEVSAGELFAILGPNGSGKSTLFRLISTLVPVQAGEIAVFGHRLPGAQHLVRQLLGVVFQSPSLDPKLTVRENLRCGGVLYGLRGAPLQARIQEVAEQLGVADRMNDMVETLSGGLKRRVELAKGILHRPRLLLMDEPSTGLDPAARIDMWRALKELQKSQRMTIVLTTHLLEEADRADRLAIMHEGRTVAVGAPGELRRELGDQVLTIRPPLPEVERWLADRGIEARCVDDEIRVTGHDVANLVPALAEQFGRQIQALSVGQPSLEDVFIARTGHRYWADRAETPAA
ncbi:MAG: ABC transporter ATP-binding protein [Planctomycetota bacterium]|nr:MAG: ABC transporter ATP-binding protein [Planctomycetota bacterium]